MVILNKLDYTKNSMISNIKTFALNFGPQHPASHGVLRLVLQLNGELVDKIDPHIGFLHRGSEKLMESRNFVQGAVYLDRLDYTSVLTQTHAYCLSVERCCVAFKLNQGTSVFRTAFDELARMLNHLLAISTHSLDVGSMATLFWAFEDRERIMELIEFVSGARMHAALYLPAQDLSMVLDSALILKILVFLKNCHKSFTEMFLILFNNRVWKLRLSGVGTLSYESALLYGAVGPILRGSGVAYDIRHSIIETYASYGLISFKTFVGITGDSYDRFLVRARELFESIFIINSILAAYCVTSDTLNMVLLNNNKIFYKTKIESLIKKFKFAAEPLKLTSTICYSAVEAGKGEFGVLLIANNTQKPYRVYLRSPAYNHLQLISLLGTGSRFADLVTIVGTLDLVFGEVDR